jgi:ATP-dependent DNA helicase RecQ
MAEQKPRTRDRLLEIPGVGQKKLDEYGDVFLAAIKED